MKVLKFGGTSVGSPERIKGVISIINSQPYPCVVVISAFQGITDELKSISEKAALGDEGYKSHLERIIERHIEYAHELVDKNKQIDVIQEINKLFENLKETLKGIFLLRELSSHSLDKTIGTGELAASLIISNLIHDSLFIDSRQFIKTDSNFGFAGVDFKTTNSLIGEMITGSQKFTVVPGFIASNMSGETTTLGRGGSDYTAAVIAAAINADILEIWTDVDGFMTADPKNVDKSLCY